MAAVEDDLGDAARFAFDLEKGVTLPVLDEEQDLPVSVLGGLRDAFCNLGLVLLLLEILDERLLRVVIQDLLIGIDRFVLGAILERARRAVI